VVPVRVARAIIAATGVDPGEEEIHTRTMGVRGVETQQEGIQQALVEGARRVRVIGRIMRAREGEAIIRGEVCPLSVFDCVNRGVSFLWHVRRLPLGQ
jgi:hypothetical protein